VVPGRARERARARGRRHLNIRGKSANLPAITDRDWLDIKFGVDVGVDYYALSFVRNAEVIYELKHWLAQQGARARAPWRHNRILRVGLWRHVEAGCVLGPRRHARRRPPAAGARRGALRAHAAAACAPGARRGQRGQAGTRLRVRACRACGGPRRPLPCALMWAAGAAPQARPSACWPRLRARTAWATWTRSWTRWTAPWSRAATWAPNCRSSRRGPDLARPWPPAAAHPWQLSGRQRRHLVYSNDDLVQPMRDFRI